MVRKWPQRTCARDLAHEFGKRAHKAGFADTFVARPIFGIVLNLLIIIAGLAALSSVDIREMPDVDRPVLSVRTTYTGAVASTVDTEVTQVLEDALSALDGMSYIEIHLQRGIKPYND